MHRPTPRTIELVADENPNPRTEPRSPDGVPEHARRCAYFLASLFVLGHLYDVATWQEHWPFSRYQMYSRLPRLEVLPKLRVYGVRDGREYALTAERHFSPLNGSRLSAVLVRAGGYRDRPELFRRAIDNLAQLYEASRRRGLHDDPPLDAIRVYQHRWNVDPWARNAKTPDQRILLVEVKTDGHIS